MHFTDGMPLTERHSCFSDQNRTLEASSTFLRCFLWVDDRIRSLNVFHWMPSVNIAYVE